jgi:hypothetical protein
LTALQIQTSGPGMAHVPVPAAVPMTPDPNHSSLFFLAALPLGLFCGISAAVLARWRDHRIYLGSDLQQTLGFAPITVLPAREEVSANVIDEYVLRLAAGVESAYRTAGAKSFVVTAVSPDTDTSTLLRDLAAKLSDLRLRVHVIRASQLLVTSQETMQHQAANAALIAAGTAQLVVEAGEGIASAKLDRLKSQFDIILIDAGPVLHSAETEYAARCADATILIAESALTQAPELNAAADLLARLRVTGVGAVLDRLKLEQADPAFRRAIRVIEQRSLEGVNANKPPLKRQAPPQPTPAPAPPPTSTSTSTRTRTPAKIVPPSASFSEDLVPNPPVAKAVAAPAEAEAPAHSSDQPAAPIPQSAATQLADPFPAQPQSLKAAILETRAVMEPAVMESAVMELIPLSTKPVAPATPAAVLHAEDAASSVDVTSTPASSAQPGPTPPAVEPLPKIDVPLADPFVPPALQSEQAVLRPEAARRSFKNWSASPEITLEETEQVLARPGARKRFELLGDLAATLPPLAENDTQPVASVQGASASEPARVSAAAAATPFLPSDQTRPAAAKGDDPNALGRFIGEKDKIGAVPPYTRSRIRLAFKEQEVNSKTTWFSKLFRGDPPSSFRIIPEDAGEGGEPASASQSIWEEPNARLPQPAAEGDPELAHLLNRIKSSGESRSAPRPRPLAPEPEPALATGPPVPFSERRAAPRLIEIDEYREQIQVPAASVAVERLPAVPMWELPALTPLAPLPAPEPISFSTSPVPASVQPLEQPESASRQSGRPLRPLTFQELAGSIEAEAANKQSALPAFPPDQPLDQPLSSVLSAEPARKVEAVAPTVPSTPIAAEIQAPAPALPESSVDSAKGQQATSPPHDAPVAPVSSISHTGMPMWPTKEPIRELIKTPIQEPIQEPIAILNAAPVEASSWVPDSEVVSEPVGEQAIPTWTSDPADAPRDFIAPSPSARRAIFERIPIVPDPMSDPAPTHRPYRLEHTPGSLERRSAPESPESVEPELESVPVSVATVAPGTSFPPDHEARQQLFLRRRTDTAEGASEIPGLTRRWKLLSQFEPVVTDPLPAHRKSHTRSTDLNPPQRGDEG